jgi:hypothetical protein
MTRSAIRTGNEQDAARKQASQLWQQGDSQGALSALLAANDSKNITALGHYQQNANGVYGTPIYGVDESGKTVLGAIGKQGQWNPIDTGKTTITPGIKLAEGPTGTTVLQGRSGQVMGGGTQAPGQPPVPGVAPGFIAKDVAGAAAEHEFGKEQGDAQAKLASMQAKLPGLKEVAKQLGETGDKATYTGVGRALDAARTELNLGPRESAVARTKYIAMVDNQILPLLRETFGAAFTQKEGESLKVTLGDPNKSPQEKRAVLEAFIEQKVRNIEATAAQIGQPVSPIKRPVRVTSPEQARRLPSGTPLILPDGSQGIVP